MEKERVEMSTNTNNYNLVKPGNSDIVNISDFNGNSDIIDAALAKHDTEIGIINTNLSVGINKFDKDTIITGTYMDTNGVLQSNANYITSAHIYLSGNTISLSQRYKSGGAVYINEFENGTWKKGSVFKNINEKSNFTTTYKEVVISTMSKNKDSLQVEDNATVSPYEPYLLTVYKNVSDRNINDIKNAEKCNFITNGKNQYNNETVILDKWLNTAGEWVNATGFATSDYINVDQSESYSVSQENTSTIYVHEFDEGHNWKKYTSFTNVKSCTLIVTYPVLVIVTAVSNKDCLQVEKGTAITSFQKYCKEIPKLNDSNLRHKTANFIGDSICYGSGYTGGYPKLLGTETGLTVRNYGYPGTLLTKTTTRTNSILERFPNMDETDCDYVIIEGAVNDCSENVPLGEITTGYTSEYDEY